MEIELTVVTTEVLNGKISPEPIETIKEELIKEFGGLTVQGCRGSWLDNGKVYEDINEKWLILTEKEVSEEKIMAYAERLRIATKQIAQLYRIDYNSFLIDAQGIIQKKKVKIQKRKIKQLGGSYEALFYCYKLAYWKHKKEIELAFSMLTREQKEKFVIAQKEFEEINHNRWKEWQQKLIQKEKKEDIMYYRWSQAQLKRKWKRAEKRLRKDCEIMTNKEIITQEMARQLYRRTARRPTEVINQCNRTEIEFIVNLQKMKEDEYIQHLREIGQIPKKE